MGLIVSSLTLLCYNIYTKCAVYSNRAINQCFLKSKRVKPNFGKWKQQVETQNAVKEPRPVHQQRDELNSEKQPNALRNLYLTSLLV